MSGVPYCFAGWPGCTDGPDDVLLLVGAVEVACSDGSAERALVWICPACIVQEFVWEFDPADNGGLSIPGESR